ncbi:TPA: hypothetical protein ACH3X2_009768 [Trebouxia sp. C0005]
MTERVPDSMCIGEDKLRDKICKSSTMPGNELKIKLCEGDDDESDTGDKSSRACDSISRIRSAVVTFTDQPS